MEISVLNEKKWSFPSLNPSLSPDNGETWPQSRGKTREAAND